MHQYCYFSDVLSRGGVLFVSFLFFYNKEQVLKQIYFKSLNKMHWCKIPK